MTRPGGQDAIDLAARTGLILDEGQAAFVSASLERREDGRWRYFEAAAIEPRQNGKGAIIEARELFGLFLDEGCKLIVHSAHEFSTALDAFRRLLERIEAVPELFAQVKRVSRSHGEEGIELDDGSRIRFKTRTKGGGRGLSADLLVLDEAMILHEHAVAALLPTLSARPNPQVLLTGSAVDQTVHEHGLVLARVRERGLAGDPELLFVEHCASVALDEVLRNPALLDDPVLWAQANPAYPHRISAESIARELALLDPRSFAVERLGIGDWPTTDPRAKGVLDTDRWAALVHPGSEIVGPVRLAVDVAPDRSRTAIGVAGLRDDGKLHVEVVAHREGVTWAAQAIADIVAKQGIREPVRLDAVGPVGTLVPLLVALGVNVKTFTAAEYVQACTGLYDAITESRVHHLGSMELNAAVAGVTTRPLGDSWVWGRRKATVDISPLVAVTLAAWGGGIKPKPRLMFARG